MGERYRELNFYKDRVQVRIEGFRLNLLLDRAMKAGLNPKSIRMVSDTELTCWVSRRDLKTLRALAKSSCRITILSVRGPVPCISGFLRRPVLLLGCLFAAAIVIFQSLLVESIQVSGYKAIPETALLECLENQGIYRGAYRPGIDWAAAEQNIYETFPQVTWVQLAYSGRLVILNISESDHHILGEDVPSDYAEGPAGTADRTYTDIIAAEAGYIESINTYYGFALAEEGDYVEKGQVLITGRVPLEPTTFQPEEELEKEYFVKAKGEVWAKVPYHLTFNQERYLWGEPAQTGPESQAGGSGSTEDAAPQTIVNRVEKTDDQARKKTEQQIRTWAKENLPETAEILNKSLKFCRVGNIIEVSVLLEVRREIAMEQEELIGTKDTDPRDS